MTAGEQMHSRMERHRHLQRERKLSDHPLTKRDDSALVKRIRADVVRRQTDDDDDDDDGGLFPDIFGGGDDDDDDDGDDVPVVTRTVTSTTSSTTSSTTRRTSSIPPPTTTPLSSSSSSTSSSSTPELTTSSSRLLTSSTRSSITVTTHSDSPTTSVQVITRSASQTSAAPTATSSETSSNTPSAGLIIGIVAAALAGVVIIAAIVGFLVKKASRKADPFDGDPFDRDEFRRQSAMIPEGFGTDDGHPSMIEHHNYGPGSYGPDEGAYAGGVLSAGAAGAYGASASHNENGAPRPPSMLARHADAYRDYQGSEAMPSYTAAFAGGPQMPEMVYGGEDPYSLAGVAGGMQRVQNIDNPYAHLDRSPSATQFHAAEAANYYASRDGTGAVHTTDLQRNGSGGTATVSNGSHSYHHQHQDTAGRPLSYEEGRSGTPDLPNVQQTYALGSQEGHSSDPSGRQSAMGTLDYPPMLNPHDEQYYQQQQYQQGSDGMHGSSLPPALKVRNLTGAAHHGRAESSGPPAYDSANRNSTVSQDPEDAYGGVY